MYNHCHLRILYLLLVGNVVYGNPFISSFMNPTPAEQQGGVCPKILDCHTLYFYRCFKDDHCIKPLKCCVASVHQDPSDKNPERCCTLPATNETTSHTLSSTNSPKVPIHSSSPVPTVSTRPLSPPPDGASQNGTTTTNNQTATASIASNNISN